MAKTKRKRKYTRRNVHKVAEETAAPIAPAAVPASEFSNRLDIRDLETPPPPLNVYSWARDPNLTLATNEAIMHFEEAAREQLAANEALAEERELHADVKDEFDRANARLNLAMQRAAVADSEFVRAAEQYRDSL